MYGFGLNLGEYTNHTTSHAMPMFTDGIGFYWGVDNLLQGYNSVTSHPSMRMSGPTYFKPLLDQLINSIRREET